MALWLVPCQERNFSLSYGCLAGLGTCRVQVWPHVHGAVARAAEKSRRQRSAMAEATAAGLVTNSPGASDAGE
ncbi:uncharacterized protein TrAFT101_010246 [Trichoderma asperellum]|uniref:uncharacterized protein n=1 Tax=Trichoderma asperellum TaxID=101201 RepID=UPI0033184B2D|nr:hypothetical protein TrAFT101_010246 [Trichoderma asperellum]